MSNCRIFTFIFFIPAVNRNNKLSISTLLILFILRVDSISLRGLFNN